MNGKPETYGELLSEAAKILGSKFEAGQLFTHITQKRLFHMHFLADKPVPAHQADLLLRMCERRKNGEPLQYLLGEWEFYGLSFKLGKGVLIPRADTESLVDIALDLLKPVQNPKILDLCSGTGCIAVALANKRPDATVTALEISDDAYGYLTKNISLNNVKVTPVKADLKDYIPAAKLNLITSNPPYIPKETIATLQKEVLYEPRKALDGGIDGLDFYRVIAKLYVERLCAFGWLCVEVGIGQSGKVAKIFSDNGLANVQAHKDYNGVERVVYGQKTNDIRQNETES